MTQKSAEEFIEASTLIDTLVDTLQYSRSHVAKIMRVNADALRAKKVNGLWMIPKANVHRLRELVLRHSGPRYKLGETGPNAA